MLNILLKVIFLLEHKGIVKECKIDYRFDHSVRIDFGSSVLKISRGHGEQSDKITINEKVYSDLALLEAVNDLT